MRQLNAKHNRNKRKHSEKGNEVLGKYARLVVFIHRLNSWIKIFAQCNCVMKNDYFDLWLFIFNIC